MKDRAWSGLWIEVDHLAHYDPRLDATAGGQRGRFVQFLWGHWASAVVADFHIWCDSSQESVGDHDVTTLQERSSDRAKGLAAVASRVPTHYISDQRIAHHLAQLGKAKTAEFILRHLPTGKTARSGDLGEILAMEYIVNRTPYQVPIKKLRWKDHRQMAMRGDDVIGLLQDPKTGRLQFLKAEVKSRAQLVTKVMNEARVGLDRDGGLPSNHALGFISSRLFELGNTTLVDAIDTAQLKSGIALAAVKHLIFTFSGNAPKNFLHASVSGYPGPIKQLAVGLEVSGHGDFVGGVYELVERNALDY